MNNNAFQKNKTILRVKGCTEYREKKGLLSVLSARMLYAFNSASDSMHICPS